MRRVWLVGACALLVGAFTASWVASASASLPAIMECVPAQKETVKYKTGKPGHEKTKEKSVYTGEYKNNKCSKADTTDKTRILGEHPGPEGKYAAQELTKVVPFTGSGKGANLEVKGVGGIGCTGAAFTGKFTGPKAAGDIVSTFSGCELAGKKCFSPGQAPGTIITNALAGAPGYLSGKGGPTPKVGADITAESGEGLAEFRCEPEAFYVTNLVIGEESPANTFTETATFLFKLHGVGEQEWKRFEEWTPGEEQHLIVHVCEVAGCNPKEGFTTEGGEEGTFVGKDSVYLEVKA